MRRGEFIALLGSAAASLPRLARGQQLNTQIIGFLSGVSPSLGLTQVAEFNRGLNETGFREGQNVIIEYRWAEDRYERLPGLAADLVSRGVSVIVANPARPALAAKTATKTVPIVFLSGADPLKSGLVTSINRPGANITGVSWFSSDLGPKRLGLIHELIPSATLMAVLIDNNATDPDFQVQEMQAAARMLGLKLLDFKVRTASEIDSAFTTLIQQRAGGLVIGAGAFFNSRRQQVIALAQHHGVPTICHKS